MAKTASKTGPKKHENAQGLAEKGEIVVSDGEVLPPMLENHPEAVKALRRVSSLKNMKGIRTEMAKVYRASRRGIIDTQTANSFIYQLNMIRQALKDEAEIGALQAGYADGWTGVKMLMAPKKK